MAKTIIKNSWKKKERSTSLQKVKTTNVGKAGAELQENVK